MGIGIQLRFRPGAVPRFDVQTDDLFPLLIPDPQGELGQLAQKLGLPAKAFDVVGAAPFAVRWLELAAVKPPFAQLSAALAARPELLAGVKPHFLAAGDVEFLPGLLARLLAAMEAAQRQGATEVAFVASD